MNRQDHDEWSERILNLVATEARRRWDSGEGSRPGRRTRLAGLANVRLVREGELLYLDAEVYAPAQDTDARADESMAVRVPLIGADGSGRPVRQSGTPEVVARRTFELLEIGD